MVRAFERVLKLESPAEEWWTEVTKQNTPILENMIFHTLGIYSV